MERIGEVFPTVEHIEIRFKRRYLSAIVGLCADEDYLNMNYDCDSVCLFEVDCKNDDCTQGSFDLYGIVASMVAKQTKQEDGLIKCSGKEARDYFNTCPCELDYHIEIIYR